MRWVRYIFSFIWISIFLLLMLLGSAWFALQFPSVQTFATKYATDYLSEKLHHVEGPIQRLALVFHHRHPVGHRDLVADLHRELRRRRPQFRRARIDFHIRVAARVHRLGNFAGKYTALRRGRRRGLFIRGTRRPARSTEHCQH